MAFLGNGELCRRNGTTANEGTQGSVVRMTPDVVYKLQLGGFGYEVLEGI